MSVRADRHCLQKRAARNKRRRRLRASGAFAGRTLMAPTAHETALAEYLRQGQWDKA